MRLRLPSLFLLLCSGSVAQAAMFCVEDGTQLAGALNSAAGNDQDDDVRITSGTKTFAVPVGFPHLFGYQIQSTSEEDNDLVISGGWNANCSAMSSGAQHTVLDGQNQDAHLLIVSRHSAYFVDPRGTYTIRNLTLTGAGYGHDALRSLLPSNNDTAEIVLDRVQVRGGSGGVYADGGRIELSNVLVTDLDAGRHAVELTPSRQNSRMVYTSVYGNRLNSILNNRAAVRLYGMSVVANNAVFGNTEWDGTPDRDVTIATSAVQYGPQIANNHFERSWMDFLSTENSSATTTGAPSIEMVTIGGYPVYQPTFGTLQDSALTFTPNPAHDVFGRARIEHGIPDRGAIESSYCRAPTMPAIQNLAIDELASGGGLHPVGTEVGLAYGNFWHATGFSISAGNTASNVFTIDASGLLRLANPAALGQQSEYFLSVSGVDVCGSTSGTVRVSVTANALFASSFE